jgi:hypothetical protein
LTLRTGAGISSNKAVLNEKTHYWKFFCAGGFDQVKLESGADLANLDQLDQKLWVALACPVHGVEFDSQTLNLIDTDKNGRVRVPELIAAAKWATSLLKNPDDLLKGQSSLPLAAINDSTPEGKGILGAVKQILAELGKKDAAEMTVDDVVAAEKIYSALSFNGDGIVPADIAGDDATKGVIADIVACEGGEPDGSGKPGVNQAKLDVFFSDAQDYANWWKQIEADKTIMPLGAATAAASVAVKAVAAKVNDYFTRCRLAAFDPRAVPALNRQAWDYVNLAEKDLSASAAEFTNFPLAQIAPGKALPLVEGVNPAWAGALANLQAAAVKPLFGDKNSITEAEWVSLQAKLAPFEAQPSGTVGASVAKLGLARVQQILTGTFRADIAALIAKDAAMEPQTSALRLVRYYRDLYTLCVNFVNFRNFYSRKEPAIFQAGTLYLDQRSCDLCLTVEDAGRHALLAGLAGAYLAYLDCVRQSTGEKLNILAVFSQGDDGNLMVGRNGIFYDRKGKDYDATITQIISNPISIAQAFWSPYKSLVRFIEKQVAQRAASANASATAGLQSAGTATATKFDTGTLAAISLVITGLITALSAIFSKLFDLPNAEIPFAIILVLLAISTPSVVVAWLKLRRRNIGPILDANGWAVNAQARMNVPFGASLTKVATLPPGSQRDLFDPYAEKKQMWPIPVLLIIIVGLGAAWYFGKLDKQLPAQMRSVTIMGTNAPAYIPPVPTNSVPPLTGTNTVASGTNAAAGK